MKKIFVHGIIAGVILIIIYFVTLFAGIVLFPGLVEEYYSPVFNMEGNKAILYFMHPFVVSFALSWFWGRFKSFFSGTYWSRGLKIGLVYGLIAVLPSMWIIFSSFAVSLSLVTSWFLYSLLQGIVVGIVNSKLNP